jgi:NADH-quinone oxidoreductase subunit H
MDLVGLFITAVKIFILYMSVVNTVPIMNWAERRGAALFQDRLGPNRVGPFGILQPIADFIKFLWKEDPVPSGANRFLYVIAPFLGLLPASLVGIERKPLC